MNRQDIKAFLQEPYQRARWLELLPTLFGQVDVFDRPQPQQIADFRADEILQLGRVQLGEHNLAILEISVGKQVDLLRNRVGLRSLVRRYIDDLNFHGVLAFFRSNQPEYRFSYASRSLLLDEAGTLVKQETAPKRFTYVFGPGEASATAARRFELLAQKRAQQQARLADVTDAFSVEKLNKEFFDQYKQHYDTFVAHILKSPGTADVFGLPRRFKSEEERDAALKPVRDFVKKTLGRLVFLHFLQKKRWLGCSPNRTDWRDGDPEFVQNLLKACTGKAQFYRDALIPLFYDTLNRAGRPNDIFELSRIPYRASRIPYLNGGLFEREAIPIQKLELPDALFGDLLEFFAQYNFTIDENDPEDHEIGIDPEMLGHIFENLLEDNKDKGAYYTPKSIVQYMGQQSLIYYLQTHLGEHASIARLVREKEADDWTRAHAGELLKRLEDVKICDPAIGSGAFPIGLLQDIYWIKLTLNPKLPRAEAKRRIIQNSIYGVDIDAGAVEIARLRCWLALIVDEDEPRPLPNLDYKIMQGDSLLESFEGIPLGKLHPTEGAKFDKPEQLGLGGIPLGPEQQTFQLTQAHAKTLRDLMEKYFEAADPAQKTELHTRIDRLVLDHLDYSLDSCLKDLGDRIAKLKSALNRKLAGLKKDQRTAYSRTAREKKQIADLEAEYADTEAKRARLKELYAKHERPYFLWHLYFQDVFERGGFDIVIANPPYVSAIESKRAGKGDEREVLRSVYKTAAGAFDLYVIFFEHAVNILKPDGVGCLITPNKYLSIEYAESLRGLLRTRTAVRNLTDASKVEVFATASVYPVITVFINAGKAASIKTDRVDSRTTAYRLFLTDLGSVEDRLLDYLPQRLWGFLINPHRHLLEKLFPMSRKLSEVATATATTTAAEADEFGKLIVDGENAGLKVINTGTIDPFVPLWGQVSLKHQGKRYPKPRLPTQPPAGKETRWELYRKPKVIFAKIAKRCEACIDLLGEFAALNANCVVDARAPYSLPFLSAYAHSNLFSFVYDLYFGGLRMSGGYYQFQAPQLRIVPVPAKVSDDIIKQMSNLALRATKAAGAELEAIRNEIDQVVYRLFDLTPDEIAIIEQATSGSKPAPDNKSALFTRVLPELKERAPYFSLSAVHTRLDELQLDIPEATLRQYMSQAMKEGVVHDAGKGWYSRLPERLELDRKPIQPLVRLMEKEFPLLDFTVWSTQQVNPWMHHLLGKFLSFVQVDKDGLGAVAEFLRERGYDVHENPSGAAARNVTPREKTVVVRPLNAHAPRDGHFAPPEAVLVDLLFETQALQIMDTGEFREMASKLATSGRLEWATLIHYAGKRERTPADIFAESNSLSAE